MGGGGGGKNTAQKVNSMSIYANLKHKFNPRILGATPTLVALERLKELHKRLSPQLLVILGRNLHTQLQVLPDVGRQHGPQTLQRVLH